MTVPLIYHGTPQTPNAAFLAVMPTRAACISFARPDQVTLAEQVCPYLMFDNAAYSTFTKGRAPDWPKFYKWLELRIFEPGRWAVIPDVIDAGSQLQDALVAEWPFGERGAPVWHTDEPVSRMLRLCERWPRVCVGSSGEHWQVGGGAWRARMDETFKALGNRHPAIHMLRGVMVARDYPFHSADSSSLGKNGWRHDKKDDLFSSPYTGRRWYADRLENYPSYAQRSAGVRLQNYEHPERSRNAPGF